MKKTKKVAKSTTKKPQTPQLNRDFPLLARVTVSKSKPKAAKPVLDEFEVEYYLWSEYDKRLSLNDSTLRVASVHAKNYKEALRKADKPGRILLDAHNLTQELRDGDEWDSFIASYDPDEDKEPDLDEDKDPDLDEVGVEPSPATDPQKAPELVANDWGYPREGGPDDADFDEDTDSDSYDANDEPEEEEKYDAIQPRSIWHPEPVTDLDDEYQSNEPLGSTVIMKTILGAIFGVIVGFAIASYIFAHK